jgi:hypothetical protein
MNTPPDELRVVAFGMEGNWLCLFPMCSLCHCGSSVEVKLAATRKPLTTLVSITTFCQSIEEFNSLSIRNVSVLDWRYCSAHFAINVSCS